jgi:hypothetical protein
MAEILGRITVADGAREMGRFEAAQYWADRYWPEGRTITRCEIGVGPLVGFFDVEGGSRHYMIAWDDEADGYIISVMGN